ncbi:MAG: hypothetical protein N2383_01930 [Caldilineales bacterium]|nr:hypothetical protein [Caldilineales bacterium]
MIIPMARVVIVGHKRHLDATLQLVQRLACVHLANATEAFPGLAAYIPTAEQAETEELAYLLARLDALLALAPAPSPTPTERTAVWETEHLAQELRRDLERHAPILEALAQRRQALRNEAEVLPGYAATLTKLMRLTPILTDLTRYETVALLIHRRYRDVIPHLAEEMRRIAGERCELVADEVDADHIGALLVFPREASGPVQALLGRSQVSQITLPETLRGVPFPEAVAHIREQLRRIPEELKAIEAELARQTARHRPRWLAARAAVLRRLEQLRARSQLGETEHTFVLVGWIPRRDLPRLRAALEAEFPHGPAIEEIPTDPATMLKAPVLLENPRPAQPFQFLVQLLALPVYGTLDPTALMALFMPLFFGLMLGDVGYGLLILLIALVARTRMRASGGLRSLLDFLAMGGAWSILWGFVFGEFFGNLGHALGLHPLWRERADPEALAPLLLFTIGLGAAHVGLGLVLGVWQAWRGRHLGEFYERAGMLVGLCGLFLLIGVIARRLPAGWITPGLAVLLIGLALLIRGMGRLGLIMAPIELLSAFGNVLSYLRLAAIGLASVYLALVGNTLAGRLGSVGLGVLVAALFHSLNLAMGAFSPTIHALRLHYVEFFSKFYEQGGEPFRPYGAA